MNPTYQNLNGQLAVLGVTQTYTLAQLQQAVADAQANLDYENNVNHPNNVAQLQAALDAANAMVAQAQSLGITQ